jgi:hypothetical protein
MATAAVRRSAVSEPLVGPSDPRPAVIEQSDVEGGAEFPLGIT